MTLAIDQVGKAFGGNIAVAEMSFAANAGEIVGIIGPNGSGKTTLMSMMAGLIPVGKGRISFAGRDITRAAPYHRSRRAISATFQKARLFDELTLRQNVELSARAKGRADESTIRACSQDWLKRLALDHVAENSAFALSGGQRKLGELARALVTVPDLILLDEPTAGVSPGLYETVGDALRQEVSRGAAVVLVSHDLPWTFKLASKVIVMAAGRILLEGSPAEVGQDSRLVDAYLA